MLQNLPYFMYKKTHVVVFFVFHFEKLWILPYDINVLLFFVNRPGHSLGKIQSWSKWKTKTNCMDFLIHKLWQILKHFSRAFSWVQTSYLWAVSIGSLSGWVACPLKSWVRYTPGNSMIIKYSSLSHPGQEKEENEKDVPREGLTSITH